MDQLELSLKPTSQASLIKNIFIGALSNEIICKDCPHKSENQEPLLALMLNVKNYKSIYESLSDFVKGEILEGENAYYCEKCEKKVKALKRTSIKKFPKNLIIVLKRFEFNLETMTRYKVNSYCEFPFDINFLEYSQQFLNKEDLRSMIDSGQINFDEFSEEEQLLNKKKFDKDSFQYKLKGIIVHAGSIESGHFYSYINDRESHNLIESENWLLFNDSEVEKINTTEIPNETFGGEDDKSFDDINAVSEEVKKAIREKTKNAYILIYEKKVVDVVADNKEIIIKENNDKNNKNEKNEKNGNISPKITPAANQKIINYILDDNKNYYSFCTNFNYPFIDFLQHIIQNSLKIEEKSNENSLIQTPQGDKNNINLEMSKFAILCFLSKIFRIHNKEYLLNNINLIKENLKRNLQLATWFMDICIHPNAMNEFIFYCPVSEKQKIFLGFIYSAIYNIYPHEKDLISNYIKDNQFEFIIDKVANEKNNGNPNYSSINSILNESKIILFMHNLIIKTAIHIKGNNELIGSIFLLFSKLADLGNEFTYFLNSYRIFGFIMEIFQEKPNHYVDSLLSLNINLTNNLPYVLENFTYNESKRDISKFEKMKAYNYLFLLFKTIVLRTKFYGYPSSKLIGLKYELNHLEEDYLGFFLNEEGLDILFNYCFTINGQIMKKASNILTSTLSHITYNNEKNCETICKFIEKRILNLENERIKPYLLFYYKKLKHPGKLYEQLYDSICSKLIDIFKNIANTGYRTADLLVDFFVKIFSKIDPVRNYFIKENYLILIESWIKENLYPQHLKVLFRLSKVKMNFILSLENISVFKKYNIQRLQILTTPKNGRNIGQNEEYDSDKDYSKKELAPKSYVDYYVEKEKEWKQLIIEGYTEEIICLKISETHHIFDDTDSELIVPLGFKTKITIKREYEQIWATIMSKAK